mmetsp:Transcript_56180/g.155550  ORF Transcript_56180/g.155550 Transcript_56180/m.155550 type:complete len:206 (-) Transcript_56180:20-637(-)
MAVAVRVGVVHSAAAFVGLFQPGILQGSQRGAGERDADAIDLGLPDPLHVLQEQLLHLELAGACRPAYPLQPLQVLARPVHPQQEGHVEVIAAATAAMLAVDPGFRDLLRKLPQAQWVLGAAHGHKAPRHGSLAALAAFATAALGLGAGASLCASLQSSASFLCAASLRRAASPTATSKTITSTTAIAAPMALSTTALPALPHGR